MIEMDPNAVLESIRELVHRSTAYSTPGLNWDDSGELVSLVDSLDDWLTTRGFLPEDWQR